MNLLIATGFYEMKGFSPYISSLVQTLSFIYKNLKLNVDFWELSGDSYVDRMRNTIANKFLESDYTDLFFIDSDMAWNIESFLRILTADADIVGAGYPCKNNWDFFGCLVINDENGKPIKNNKGLIKADGVPTGFMKIRKAVFDGLTKEYPDSYYIENGKKVWDFFSRIQPFGEDMSFCKRWRDIGGEIYIEPDCNIGHFGVKGWYGNYKDSLLEKGLY